MQCWLAGAGEAQLADAVALNAKLQGEVDQLNDTVFSKTFRAPSAWAEREVKYKMDKKAWDSQVGHFSCTHVVGVQHLLLFHTRCLTHNMISTYPFQLGGHVCTVFSATLSIDACRCAKSCTGKTTVTTK